MYESQRVYTSRHAHLAPTRSKVWAQRARCGALAKEGFQLASAGRRIFLLSARFVSIKVDLACGVVAVVSMILDALRTVAERRKRQQRARSPVLEITSRKLHTLTDRFPSSSHEPGFKREFSSCGRCTARAAWVLSVVISAVCCGRALLAADMVTTSCRCRPLRRPRPRGSSWKGRTTGIQDMHTSIHTLPQTAGPPPQARQRSWQRSLVAQSALSPSSWLRTRPRTSGQPGGPQ